MISARSRPRSVFEIAALALILSGCASAAPHIETPACPAGLSRATEFKLFLGGSIPRGGDVSAAAFKDFIAKSVIPEFPRGFTVAEAEGYYLPQGALVPMAERAKILIVVAPETEPAGQAVARIAAAYKTRFDQDSVGIVQEPVCAAF